MINAAMSAGIACLVFLAGCANIEGKWVSQTLDPTMARDQFRFLRPSDFRGDFITASFDLREDGTFSAQTYYSPGMGFSSGAWNLIANRLTFRDNQYGAYTYRIKLSRDRKTMTIFQLIKGTDVKLILRRHKTGLRPGSSI